jgi:hypothetical protein
MPFIPYVLLAVAAMLSAVQDTIAHHYLDSIFIRFDEQRYWNLYLSNAKPIYLRGTRYKVDAWHNAKSLMIISISIAILLYKPLFHFKFHFFAELALMGIIWNAVFNIFYNRLLLIKKSIKMSNASDEIKWQAKPQDNFEKINKYGLIALFGGLVISLAAYLIGGGMNTIAWIGGIIGIAGVLTVGGNALYNNFKKKPSGQGKQ